MYYVGVATVLVGIAVIIYLAFQNSKKELIA